MAFAMAGFNRISWSPAAGSVSQRWSVDTSYTVDQEIAAGNEAIDKFDPSTLGSVWYTFSEMGMRNKQYPYFYLAKLYADERV